MNFKIILVVITLLLLTITGWVVVFRYVRSLRESTVRQVDSNGNEIINIKNIRMEKPAIYLYPTQETQVNVRVEPQEIIFASYPRYDASVGWTLLARPNGQLKDLSNNSEYSYLFWEGNLGQLNFDLSRGFVVKGEDTLAFLEKILPELGLKPAEYNDFIVYWYPRMKSNKYNLVHFAGKEYTEQARLVVTPTPDSMLRVFMVYKPLEKDQYIQPQKLPVFERRGFAVVEWGGAEI